MAMVNKALIRGGYGLPYSRRRRRLLEAVKRLGCAAAATMKPPNIFYLTGYWGEGLALLTPEALYLYTSQLEAERARNEGHEVEVVPYQRAADLYRDLHRRLDPTFRLCFDDLPASQAARLKRRLKRPVTFTMEPFLNTRRVKEPEEVAAIREAGKVLDSLFELATQVLKPGVSERALAACLTAEALCRGLQPPNHPASLNPLVVASGPLAALPHAEFTDRNIEEGDLVVIDLFFRYKGYVCDATRTLAVRRVEEEKRQAYDAVLEAQEAALTAARPGARCGEVDRAARRILHAKGYAKYFIHSTGHGVGLEVHEAPWLRQGERTPLQAGDAVTIEPGVYIPQRFGIRIEDTLLVGEGGGPATNFPKSLQVV